MKFGVRECVDVMFKAKSTRSIGSKIFYKNEPVLLFDTLTTSTLEGTGSPVYVTGGRGNARLMSWDGDRAVTFTMENALLSRESIGVLTSAQVINAGNRTNKNEKTLYIHTTSRIELDSSNFSKTPATDDDPASVTITLPETPYAGNGNEDFIYVMLLDDQGDMKSEPYIATVKTGTGEDGKKIEITKAAINGRTSEYDPTVAGLDYKFDDFKVGAVILVDYYVAKTSGAFQVEIAPEVFGGNFYIEGSTLFRDQGSGKDMPAEIIIPSGKIQSAFSFTLSGSGDPSSFTFTLDAFPDYTRFDKTKKVFADIQVVTEAGGAGEELRRMATESADTIKADGTVVGSNNG